MSADIGGSNGGRDSGDGSTAGAGAILSAGEAATLSVAHRIL